MHFTETDRVIAIKLVPNPDPLDGKLLVSILLGLERGF
jgi:hypothetical protein